MPIGMAALQQLETLGRKKKTGPQAPPKPVHAERVDKPEEVETAEHIKIVRTPRTTPAPIQKRVDKLSGGEAIVDDGRLGKSVETQIRRQQVTAWMLDGHTFDGELCDIPMLALKLGVPKRTIDTDIIKIKERMAEFYTKDDDTRDIAALAHMLLEMKFRDRGLALNLFNKVLQDLAAADANAAKRKAQDRFSKLDGFGEISGRDRAAMYSTALAAIDLANRTTNGMSDLLKLTGGAKKLQLIIQAKNVMLAKGNGTFNMEPMTIQVMINKMMGGVLPSNRHQDAQLSLPAELELDDDDRSCLQVGEEDERPKGKVIDAKQ